MSGAPSAATTESSRREPTSGWDRYFQVSQRGSTLGREVRGGLVTFFTMAYIIVLNPLIIGTATDADGNFLGGGKTPNLALVAAATALVAGVLTIADGRRRRTTRWRSRRAWGSTRSSRSRSRRR